MKGPTQIIEPDRRSEKECVCSERKEICTSEVVVVRQDKFNKTGQRTKGRRTSTSSKESQGTKHI